MPSLINSNKSNNISLELQYIYFLLLFRVVFYSLRRRILMKNSITYIKWFHLCMKLIKKVSDSKICPRPRLVFAFHVDNENAIMKFTDSNSIHCIAIGQWTCNCFEKIQLPQVCSSICERLSKVIFHVNQTISLDIIHI